jgi:hypothetical protein
MRQKFTCFARQAIGNVVTAGVVVFLMLAWIFTAPFMQLCDQFAGKAKVKNK